MKLFSLFILLLSSNVFSQEQIYFESLWFRGYDEFGQRDVIPDNRRIFTYDYETSTPKVFYITSEPIIKILDFTPNNRGGLYVLEAKETKFPALPPDTPPEYMLYYFLSSSYIQDVGISGAEDISLINSIFEDSINGYTYKSSVLDRENNLLIIDELKTVYSNPDLYNPELFYTCRLKFIDLDDNSLIHTYERGTCEPYYAYTDDTLLIENEIYLSDGHAIEKYPYTVVTNPDSGAKTISVGSKIISVPDNGTNNIKSFAGFLAEDSSHHVYYNSPSTIYLYRNGGVSPVAYASDFEADSSITAIDTDGTNIYLNLVSNNISVSDSYPISKVYKFPIDSGPSGREFLFNTIDYYFSLIAFSNVAENEVLIDLSLNEYSFNMYNQSYGEAPIIDSDGSLKVYTDWLYTLHIDVVIEDLEAYENQNELVDFDLRIRDRVTGAVVKNVTKSISLASLNVNKIVEFKDFSFPESSNTQYKVEIIVDPYNKIAEKEELNNFDKNINIIANTIDAKSEVTSVELTETSSDAISSYNVTTIGLVNGVPEEYLDNPRSGMYINIYVLAPHPDWELYGSDELVSIYRLFDVTNTWGYSENGFHYNFYYQPLEGDPSIASTYVVDFHQEGIFYIFANASWFDWQTETDPSNNGSVPIPVCIFENGAFELVKSNISEDDLLEYKLGCLRPNQSYDIVLQDIEGNITSFSQVAKLNADPAVKQQLSLNLNGVDSGRYQVYALIDANISNYSLNIPTNKVDLNIGQPFKIKTKKVFQRSLGFAFDIPLEVESTTSFLDTNRVTEIDIKLSIDDLGGELENADTFEFFMYASGRDEKRKISDNITKFSSDNKPGILAYRKFSRATLINYSDIDEAIDLRMKTYKKKLNLSSEYEGDVILDIKVRVWSGSESVLLDIGSDLKLSFKINSCNLFDSNNDIAESNAGWDRQSFYGNSNIADHRYLGRDQKFKDGKDITNTISKVGCNLTSLHNSLIALRNGSRLDYMKSSLVNHIFYKNMMTYDPEDSSTGVLKAFDWKDTDQEISNNSFTIPYILGEEKIDFKAVNNKFNFIPEAIPYLAKYFGIRDLRSQSISSAVYTYGNSVKARIKESMCGNEKSYKVSVKRGVPVMRIKSLSQPSKASKQHFVMGVGTQKSTSNFENMLNREIFIFEDPVAKNKNNLASEGRHRYTDDEIFGKNANFDNVIRDSVIYYRKDQNLASSMSFPYIFANAYANEGEERRKTVITTDSDDVDIEVSKEGGLIFDSARSSVLNSLEGFFKYRLGGESSADPEDVDCLDCFSQEYISFEFESAELSGENVNYKVKSSVHDKTINLTIDEFDENNNLVESKRKQIYIDDTGEGGFTEISGVDPVSMHKLKVLFFNYIGAKKFVGRYFKKKWFKRVRNQLITTVKIDPATLEYDFLNDKLEIFVPGLEFISIPLEAFSKKRNRLWLKEYKVSDSTTISRMIVNNKKGRIFIHLKTHDKIDEKKISVQIGNNLYK